MEAKSSNEQQDVMKLSPSDFVQVFVNCAQTTHGSTAILRDHHQINNRVNKLKFLLPSTPIEVVPSTVLQKPVMARPMKSTSSKTVTKPSKLVKKIVKPPHRSLKNIPNSKQRAYHNALERQRRQLITSSLNELKNALPEASLESIQEKSSRCFTLNKACDYIRAMEENNAEMRKEIAILAEDNLTLEQRIFELESQKDSKH
eukprot:TCONS_00053734-protein